MSEKPLALLRPYRDEEARANLHSYINIRDRGGPPVFVGREDIFQRLAKDVEECRSNTRGSTCFTRVIQGAPGAGKTSLIEEVQERLGQGIGKSKRFHDAVVVVSVSGGMFFREAFVANRIIEACTGEDFDVQKERSSSTSAQAGAAGFGASHGRTTKDRSLEQQIQSAGELWKSVVDHTSINTDDTVLLLLIDEAQSIRGVASESGENHIVMNLHEGSNSTRGLKIVPVFVGLSDTKSVLKNRGISRFPRASAISLGSLSREETEELVSGWMRHEPFGFANLFSNDDITRVSNMIAVASEGWPRHANTYLSELARAVLAHDGSEDLAVDLDEILNQGHEHRLSYYGERVSSAGLGIYSQVIRDAAQQASGGIVLMSTLRTIAQKKYGIAALDVDDRHEKAVRAGIFERVTEYDDERFKFPIPSFYTFMQCDLDRIHDQFLEKMRAQIAAESHRWSESKRLGR